MIATSGPLTLGERRFLERADTRAKAANDAHDRRGDRGLVSVLTAARRPRTSGAAHSASMTTEIETPKPEHRYVQALVSGRIGRVLYEDPRTGTLTVETMSIGKVVTDTFFWSPATVTAVEDITTVDSTRKLIDEACNITAGDVHEGDHAERYTRSQLVGLIEDLGGALAAMHSRAVAAEQANR